MRRTHRSWVLALLAVLALVATACGRGGGETKAGTSDPGITATTIKLGGSYPFSGPASAYGTIGVSAKAYFDWLNAKGGVNGRKIEFTTLDDGYEPARALQNAKRLVEQDKVVVLYQNDAFGKDLLDGFKSAVQGSGTQVVAAESYEVTDPSVASQLSKLASSNADVFLDITTPKFAAQAIHGLTQIDWKPLHILNNVSASKTLVLQPAGLAASKGIVSVSYFKDPEDPRWASDPAMQEYKAGLRQYAPSANVNEPFNVYGWAVASTMAKALGQRKQPTRAALMDAVRNMKIEIPLLLPGISVQTSPTDGYHIQDMQVMRFDGQHWQLLGNVIQTQ